MKRADLNRSWTNFLSVTGILITFACVSSLIAGAQQNANPFEVRPSETDRGINSFDDPHVCWLPTGSPRNQLVLFIPGTNGVPRENFPFLNTASALGFHGIFLMYPDTIAAQQACPNSPDPGAYMKFRLAIIRGGNYEGMQISQSDSIENRFAKLLVFLSRSQPANGWSQFVDSSGNPDWTKIIVAGQSQGGGHAFVLAKIHNVARALMFGSPKDYSVYLRRPAQGFDTNTKTSRERFFAYNNTNDNIAMVDHERQMEIFRQMGLTSLGTAEINQGSEDLRNAHLIFTSATPANLQNRTQYHGSVIGAVFPFNKKVWSYMLTAPVD